MSRPFVEHVAGSMTVLALSASLLGASKHPADVLQSSTLGSKRIQGNIAAEIPLSQPPLTTQPTGPVSLPGSMFGYTVALGESMIRPPHTPSGPDFLGRDPEIDAAAMLSGWFRESLAELGTLATMPPNWDGYGSRPIQPVAQANMIRVLNVIAAVAPKPQLFPISGGALQAEWFVEGRDLEIVSRSDGSITCVTMMGDDEDSIEADVYDGVHRAAILAKVSWLVGTGDAHEAAA